MSQTPEGIAQAFTRDGQYLCARWGRPVAPVIFGLADDSLDIFRSAIHAAYAHAGHPLAETDPELGANLLMFFCQDWDELAGVRDLDKLTGQPDLIARLRAGGYSAITDISSIAPGGDSATWLVAPVHGGQELSATLDRRSVAIARIGSGVHAVEVRYLPSDATPGRRDGLVRGDLDRRAAADAALADNAAIDTTDAVRSALRHGELDIDGIALVQRDQLFIGLHGLAEIHAPDPDRAVKRGTDDFLCDDGLQICHGGAGLVVGRRGRIAGRGIGTGSVPEALFPIAREELSLRRRRDASNRKYPPMKLGCPTSEHPKTV